MRDLCPRVRTRIHHCERNTQKRTVQPERRGGADGRCGGFSRRPVRLEPAVLVLPTDDRADR